ncbi:MAG: transketolase, partial [bacterium]|nr:transketolase [bacterium]
MITKKELERIARNIRVNIIKMAYSAGGTHIAPSFSSVEILTVLYKEILNIDPSALDADDRDRFILGKGHASAAIFATLAEFGILDKKELKTYCQPGSILGGHPERDLVPGIEASTGSLGHGLALGAGMAFAGKMDKKDYRVFVLMGDGECQEGSVWESAAFIPQHKLTNLTAIIDYNKLQALDRLENILGLEPMADKWRAFGWEVKEVDGHNVEELLETFKKVPFSEEKPGIVIAHTTKG